MCDLPAPHDFFLENFPFLFSKNPFSFESSSEELEDELEELDAGGHASLTSHLQSSFNLISSKFEIVVIVNFARICRFWYVLISVESRKKNDKKLEKI